MNKIKTIAALALALAASSAFADPIIPAYDTFGKLDGATYGGSGIPNDPSAITQAKDIDGNVIMVNGQAALTLGMIATPRYSSPAVANNGAGTYTAVNGAFAPPPGGDTNYARWNFDYYIGGANATGRTYTYRLYYDFDAAAGTDMSQMGYIDLGSSAGQDSWNLGMNFLATSAFGAAPAFAAFDPNAVGEYSFALVAYSDGVEAARAAILVNVPEPASMALVGIALLGAGAASRRRRA